MRMSYGCFSIARESFKGIGRIRLDDAQMGGAGWRRIEFTQGAAAAFAARPPLRGFELRPVRARLKGFRKLVTHAIDEGDEDDDGGDGVSEKGETSKIVRGDK